MPKTENGSYDVVIIGGGPAGSTAGTLLRKYNPSMRVLILEKDAFPRDHIGESQLPSISNVLAEMEVWDKVEAAGFPIKIGASYTWGRSEDRWDFDFFPVEQWEDQPRPAPFEGQRRYTAFQVDRALYDDILLRHAESMGCEARQRTRVEEVLRDGDRITGLRLHTGETVTAQHYIDASGVVGLVRRAMGIGSFTPVELRNIAIWDYWQNAEWAVEIGVGATRVQVRSLPYGWIWFIPLGPTRTSVGVICPAEHYRKTGKTPDELYLAALAQQPDIAALLASAEREGPVQSCKDWSHLADRIVGENWFLTGEACGFADPILAAGMSLAHSSAREAAYAILELERGELDAAWIRERFNDRNRLNIEQHIRFAQYWYAANSCFTDLKENCSAIAKEAGLRLTPDQAWRWLSQGGFTTENPTLATFGSFDVASAKQILERFDSGGRKCKMLVDGHNVFKLNLHNATKSKIGDLRDGRINTADGYERGGKKLPLLGIYGELVKVLEQTSDAREIFDTLQHKIAMNVEPAHRHYTYIAFVQALEALIQEDWVLRGVNKKRPMMNVSIERSRYIRDSEETEKVLATDGAKGTIKSNI